MDNKRISRLKGQIEYNDPMYKKLQELEDKREQGLVIELPIALYLRFQIDWVFGLTFVINAIIHCVVDDLKANKKILNLVLDQSIHIIQILATYGVFVTAMI